MADVARRILIVDDEPQNLFVWCAALERFSLGCSVETAENGQEALAKMQDGSFDLIVTDLCMPEMDGYELTKHIRRLYGPLPVIWITAHRQSDTGTQAASLGVFCCLDKPMPVAMMREAVCEALEATAH